MVLLLDRGIACREENRQQIVQITFGILMVMTNLLVFAHMGLLMDTVDA
jgi:hypothetical protein